MGTLTSGAVKDRYTKLVWYNASNNQVYKTSEDGNDTDTQITAFSGITSFVSGAVTFDSSGDITLSADGGNIKMDDGSITVFDFDVDNTSFIVHDDQDTGDFFKLQVAQHGATTLSTTDDDATAANLTLDIDGDIALSAEGGNVTMDDGTTTIFDFNVDDTAMTIHDDEDTGDKFSITVAQHGATTFETVDDDAAAANLQFNVDGNFLVNAAGNYRFEHDSSNYFQIAVGADGATTLSTVDDGVGTFNGNLIISPDGDFTAGNGAQHCTIKGGPMLLDSASIITLEANNVAGTSFTDNDLKYAQVSNNVNGGRLQLFDIADNDNYFEITTIDDGVTAIKTVDGSGAVAHLNVEIDGHIEFDGCGVGFDLVTPTFNAADTNVDFKTGNKQMLTLSGNVADLNLTFPATSGNFTLLLKQDGTGNRTIAADGYLVFEHDGSAATVPNVKFPGGTVPTLTTAANHVDIISFFWDSDNQVCYGVASLDFQD